MVPKKSRFCPKGPNFAIVASFRAKSQIPNPVSERLTVSVSPTLVDWFVLQNIFSGHVLTDDRVQFWSVKITLMNRNTGLDEQPACMGSQRALELPVLHPTPPLPLLITYEQYAF